MSFLRNENYCTISDIAIWIGKSRFVAKNITFDANFPESILDGKRHYWIKRDVKKYLKKNVLLAPQKN